MQNGGQQVGLAPATPFAGSSNHAAIVAHAVHTAPSLPGISVIHGWSSLLSFCEDTGRQHPAKRQRNRTFVHSSNQLDEEAFVGEAESRKESVLTNRLIVDVDWGEFDDDECRIPHVRTPIYLQFPSGSRMSWRPYAWGLEKAQFSHGFPDANASSTFPSFMPSPVVTTLPFRPYHPNMPNHGMVSSEWLPPSSVRMNGNEMFPAANPRSLLPASAALLASPVLSSLPQSSRLRTEPALSSPSAQSPAAGKHSASKADNVSFAAVMDTPTSMFHPLLRDETIKLEVFDEKSGTFRRKAAYRCRKCGEIKKRHVCREKPVEPEASPLHTHPHVKRNEKDKPSADCDDAKALGEDD